MKALILKKIPKDVFDIVIIKQAETKIHKGTNQWSFESTLYNIVREWKKCMEAKQIPQ